MTTLDRFCSLVGTALLCSCLPFAVAYSRGVTVALPTQIDPNWWTLWTLVGIGLVAVPSLCDGKKFYRCFLILAMACLTGLMVMLPYEGG